jgi:uncharacterized protein (DUF58 family)
MHLAGRAYLLIVVTAVLAVAAIWSDDPGTARLWHIPLGLLLLGLALESYYTRRNPPRLRVRSAERARLGAPQVVSLLFENRTRRRLALEFAPAVPPGFEAAAAVRRVSAPARGSVEERLTLLPVRLGPQPWPPLPARVLGPLSLAWWPLALDPAARLAVSPDTLGPHQRVRGLKGGSRPRRLAGAGAELHQLRDYVHGDPLSRIDWKATARAGRLMTREFSEDQHLDVVVAIDAGRFSRVRAGRLDRLALYANVAARFAELVTQQDDRVGLLVYADRSYARLAPQRGLGAVVRVRQALTGLSVQPAESDPTAAAVTLRALLRHRALIVLLTDLDDASIADQLARAVRLLSPPHLVVVAGVHSGEIATLAQQPAQGWRDPWVALAAAEHEARAAAQRSLLQRLGVPVIATPAGALEQALFSEYEALRRRRRV